MAAPIAMPAPFTKSLRSKVVVIGNPFENDFPGSTKVVIRTTREVNLGAAMAVLDSRTLI